MAFYSEETFAAKKKPAALKIPPKDTTAIAIKQMAESLQSSSDVIIAASEATTEDAAQTKALIEVLVSAISVMLTHTPSSEPTPVRLVINRKDRLINTIDVIPLTKKAAK